MSYTNRERLLTTLRGNIPDCVPVAPDFSYMIPARQTGKPFWDVFLYNDPPQWEAYIQTAKYFDIDSLMDGYFPLTFSDEPGAPDPERMPYFVHKTEDMRVVQYARKANGNLFWEDRVHCYYRADSPTHNLPPAKLHLPEIPDHFEPVEGIKPVDKGPEGLKRIKELMGDQGLVGVYCASTAGLNNEKKIIHYMEHPEKHEEWAQERVECAEKRFANIMAMEVQPDFLCVGGSGTLVFQTVPIFRQLTFPAVKRTIELASAAGMMTHVHSCGPEAALVKIMAEETDLTVIDPLEIPPMGDCNLAELKRLYGDKITLKGNLHTTNVMLRGTPEDVVAASRKAIDEAAEGGRFILSTGDQCGRDTPEENLFAMVQTAREYGRYT